MFFEGKNTEFFLKENTGEYKEEALNLWFREGKKGNFLSQLHQILKKSKKSDPS